MTEPIYQVGFISPLREHVRKREPRRKREPIGFVHFGGEPEEEPSSHLDEYVQFVLDGDRNEDDELLVGFTAPDDVI